MSLFFDALLIADDSDVVVLFIIASSRKALIVAGKVDIIKVAREGKVEQFGNYVSFSPVGYKVKNKRVY